MKKISNYTSEEIQEYYNIAMTTALKKNELNAVKEKLIEVGCPNELIEDISKKVIGDRKQISINYAKPSIIVGIIIFLIGLIITVVSYTSTEENGTFTVMYGAILVGLWIFGKGIYKLIIKDVPDHLK